MKKQKIEITKEYVFAVCKKCNLIPITVQRFLIGQGNYVFRVTAENGTYVARCANQSYRKTVRLLKRLTKLEINVPVPLRSGKYKGNYFMICTYIKGADLGKVYHTLSDSDKKAIAKDVVAMQRRVSKLRVNRQQAWTGQVRALLNRAKERISANGYFDAQKVDAIERLIPHFQSYLSNVHSVAYLDDISTKNLLIDNKRVSGVIDIDWLGCGDPLSFIALTYMALLDMQYDTDYVNYLLAEMGDSESEYKAFLFYALVYCVDFMGERGMTFCGKTVQVDTEIVNKLNRIYENLFTELQTLLEA